MKLFFFIFEDITELIDTLPPSIIVIVTFAGLIPVLPSNFSFTRYAMVEGHSDDNLSCLVLIGKENTLVDRTSSVLMEKLAEIVTDHCNSDCYKYASCDFKLDGDGKVNLKEKDMVDLTCRWYIQLLYHMTAMKITVSLFSFILASNLTRYHGLYSFFKFKPGDLFWLFFGSLVGIK